MKEENVIDKIKNRMQNSPKGTIYTNGDFLDLGNELTIRSALSRLHRRKEIYRLIDGYYTIPFFVKTIEEYSYPSPIELANKIAKNYAWKICPFGDTALNQMGLSTQVPATYEFISDGPYREIMYQGQLIKFRHTANRYISNFSRPLALVIQSIKALGKENITKKHINKLSNYCLNNVNENIIQDTKCVPAWIYEILKKISEVMYG